MSKYIYFTFSMRVGHFNRGSFEQQPQAKIGCFGLKSFGAHDVRAKLNCLFLRLRYFKQQNSHQSVRHCNNNNNNNSNFDFIHPAFGKFLQQISCNRLPIGGTKYCIWFLWELIPLTLLSQLFPHLWQLTVHYISQSLLRAQKIKKKESEKQLKQ